MSNSGADAADQVVSMSLKTLDTMLRLSGTGAKNIAVLIYTLLSQQEKTEGQVRLKNLLKSGKELYVFSISKEDMQVFAEESKKYGVTYCAIKDKGNVDNMVDVIVKAEDAYRINRIVERFKLATVDIASIKDEIEKSDRNEIRKDEIIDDKTAENLLEALLENPSTAEMDQTQTAQNPSEPILEDDYFEPLKSVREDLRAIKKQQNERTSDSSRKEFTLQKPGNYKGGYKDELRNDDKSK